MLVCLHFLIYNHIYHTQHLRTSEMTLTDSFGKKSNSKTFVCFKWWIMFDTINLECDININFFQIIIITLDANQIRPGLKNELQKPQVHPKLINS